jgi:hypothetical protein
MEFPKARAMFQDWSSALLLSVAGAGTLFAIIVSRRRLAGVWPALVRVSPIGHAARVCIPVPAGGVGAISYVVASRRTTMPARSEQGDAIDLGTPVVVLEIQRRVAIVSPLPDEIKEMFQ